MLRTIGGVARNVGIRTLGAMNRTTFVSLIALVLFTGRLAPAADGGEAAPASPATTASVVLVGDSNTWFWNQPVAAHRVMEHLLQLLPYLDSPWRDAKVHNLAISGSRPKDWIVEKRVCNPRGKKRYPIYEHCDEIDFLAEGITKVVPKPDAIIVSLGLNSHKFATPAESAEYLAKLKVYLEGISPRVIMTPPFPMPREPFRSFVADVRREMLARDLVDWDWPELELKGKGIHLTERARVVHGSLMALWLSRGAPPIGAGIGTPDPTSREATRKPRGTKKARGTAKRAGQGAPKTRSESAANPVPPAGAKASPEPGSRTTPRVVAKEPPEVGANAAPPRASGSSRDSAGGL